MINEEEKFEFAKEIANTADYFPKQQTVRKDFSIEQTAKEFWQSIPGKDYAEYYKHGGVVARSHAPSKTSTDFIAHVDTAKLEYIKKMFADSEVKMSEQTAKLVSTISELNTVLQEILLVELGRQHDNQALDQEAAVAFFSGFVNKAYTKLKELYTDE